MTNATDEQLSLYSVIVFSDDGDCECTPLGHGMSREQCDQLAAMIPAVSYSGSRPVKEAYLTAVPTSRVLRAVDGWRRESPEAAEPSKPSASSTDEH